MTVPLRPEYGDPTADELDVWDAGVASTVAMEELARRMTDQWSRLTGPPIPVDFTYDRNGLRLGIAALEDEIREVYDEWAAGKKRLDDPAVAERLASELLDVASVAMLIYRNIPAATIPNRQCHINRQHDATECDGYHLDPSDT